MGGNAWWITLYIYMVYTTPTRVRNYYCCCDGPSGYHVPVKPSWTRTPLLYIRTHTYIIYVYVINNIKCIVYLKVFYCRLYIDRKRSKNSMNRVRRERRDRGSRQGKRDLTGRRSCCIIIINNNIWRIPIYLRIILRSVHRNIKSIYYTRSRAIVFGNEYIINAIQARI